MKNNSTQLKIMADKINTDKVVKYWIITSDKDYRTMLHLHKSKDYHWTLFMGHLVIEKLLKGHIVRATGIHAPFSHDLQYLAKISKLDFTENHLDSLAMITTFNLNARYDSYKQEFYKKCSPEFTRLWVNNIKEIRLWIKQKLSE